MNYNKGHNDHDFMEPDHIARFLRNHKTGTDNLGRRTLGQIVATYDNPTVLDCASGTAVNWEVFKGMQVPCNYIAFDRTEKLLGHARELYGDEITYIQGFAQEVDQVEEDVDVIIIRHLLEHIPGGAYHQIVMNAVKKAKKEVVVVFFETPTNIEEDVISERSSNIEGHPEITHFWNTYSLLAWSSFISTLNVDVKVGQVYTPGAAHVDTIFRLIKK